MCASSSARRSLISLFSADDPSIRAVFLRITILDGSTCPPVSTSIEVLTWRKTASSGGRMPRYRERKATMGFIEKDDYLFIGITM